MKESWRDSLEGAAAVAALSPSGAVAVQQPCYPPGSITGQSRLASGPTVWDRMLSLVLGCPRVGTIIVTSSAVPFETRLILRGSLGGPEIVQVWATSPIEIPFAGEAVVLDMRAVAATRLSAVLGWTP